MTNPPNRPRDDRRMHEGEKPGIGEKRERGEQEEVRLDRDRDESESRRQPIANRKARSSAVTLLTGRRPSRPGCYLPTRRYGMKSDSMTLPV